MKTIYRAEVIGSLLRPAYLWEARRSLRSKDITPAQFKMIEDRAVDEAIALQEAAGSSALAIAGGLGPPPTGPHASDFQSSGEYRQGGPGY